MPEDWETLLDAMVRIRCFEDEVKGLFASGLVRGSTHLCQGQEAVSVGACSRLEDGDTMTCTYRGHGAVLAKGAEMEACFAEILGRAAGLCGGKGGSMHFADFRRGAIGANAIVGAHLPIAVGAAFAHQYKGTDRASLAFTGDGSTNIGAFHEAMNLAAIWRLPLILIIENNHYGEYSPQASTTPITRLADRAISYGIPGVCVDGNDILAVIGATAAAIARARSGDGPTIIEADTYRFEGHSRSDPATYRPPGELDSWLKRDPIAHFEGLVIAAGFSDSRSIETRRSRLRSETSAALVKAKSFPEPPISALYQDVFA